MQNAKIKYVIYAFLILIIIYLAALNIKQNVELGKQESVKTLNIILTDSPNEDSSKQIKGHLQTDYNFFNKVHGNKSYHYSILSIEQNNKEKCVVYIRIKEKITNDAINLIAEDLKTKLNPNSNRMHIFFLLPQHQIGNGAWVRVDYSPDYHLFYIGQSMEAENIVIDQVKQIHDAVGIWEDPSENEGLVLRIRRDPEYGLIIETILASDPNPSAFASQIKRTIIQGKEGYTELDNSFGEYYVVENNGDLSLYDKQGFVVTYRKLK